MHSAHLRRILVILASLLLLLAGLDSITSGPLAVAPAALTQLQEASPVTIRLPHRQHTLWSGRSYTFAFSYQPTTFDRWKTLQLAPYGCMRSVSINSTRVQSFDGTSAQCDYNKRFLLADIKAPVHFSVTIDPVPIGFTPGKHDNGGLLGLSLTRDPWFSPAQSLLLCSAALYLLCLCLIKNRRQFQRFHYAAGVLLLFAISNLGDSYSYRSLAELFLQIAPGLGALLLAVWLVKQEIMVPVTASISHCLAAIRALPLRLFVTAGAFLFLLLAAGLSQAMFGGMPHIADTHIQYVGAKMLAEGHFTEPSHPHKEFFDFQNAINDGKFYTSALPGNLLLLALAYKFGVPWLLNPLLGALTLAAVFLLTREVAGRNAGYVAALLMLMCPMVVFMSSEYMNHVATMFFLTMFAYAYIRQHRTLNMRMAALAGCMLGGAVITRAQSAAPFAFCFILHALWHFCKEPKRRFKPYAILSSCCCLFLAFLAYFDWITTGQALVPAYALSDYDNFYQQFTHLERWTHLGKDLLRALPQLAEIHRTLFDWPGSSLIFVLLLFLCRADRPDDRWLLLPCLGMCLGLIFIFPDNGIGAFGTARYAYEMNGCLIALTAIALTRAPYILQTRFGLQLNTRESESVITLTVLILGLTALPKINDQYALYSDHYFAGNNDYYYMLTHSIETPALVLMKDYRDYRMVYFTMPPHDSNPIVFALDQGQRVLPSYHERHETNQQLMDYYPTRHVYIVNGWDVVKVR